MIILGQNNSLLQAIKMKLLALEHQKDLKSVFHFSRHVFTSQAFRRLKFEFWAS
jgi:type IV secretory pathway VirB4 component